MPLSLKIALFEKHPELTGMFCKGMPSMLTDNQHSNVSEQIVNGTKGLMEGLVWLDATVEAEVEKK